MSHLTCHILHTNKYSVNKLFECAVVWNFIKSTSSYFYYMVIIHSFTDIPQCVLDLVLRICQRHSNFEPPSVNRQNIDVICEYLCYYKVRSKWRLIVIVITYATRLLQANLRDSNCGHVSQVFGSVVDCWLFLCRIKLIIIDRCGLAVIAYIYI